MRIVMISTYPPIECGIGTYSKYLTDALKKTENEIYVVSQYGAKGDTVFPAYNSDDCGLSKKIFDTVKKLAPDIIHIQHEFGLFGEMDGVAVLDLIIRAKVCNIPVVTTLHTVRKDFEYRKRRVLEEVCKQSDSLIVHEKDHIPILTDFYGIEVDKIHQIYHGARTAEPIKDAKEKLGLTGKKVVLLLGYIRQTKGFHRIIDIFPSIVKEVDNAYLVLASQVRVSEFNEYRNSLFKKINSSPVKENIIVFDGKFPQRTFDYILNAADVLPFAYTLGAQSGIMAHALSFGKPVVVSELEAFKNIIKDSSAGLIAESDKEFAEKIIKILKDDKLYERLSNNAFKYVREKISWDIVAAKTVDIYYEFREKPPCNSRHVYLG
ncbi:MAG: glycosyltransferase [Victivallales bacterium]|nr:glycosyltransferase [Victivallales bacterium]